MNDEIKEILDRLERIDHKEYSCAFEFADSSTFDEMARCFKERKKMADYITNLQQENERLKETIKHYEDTTTFGDYVKEVNLLIDYKSRCEKAVKYIDTNFCIENRRDLKEVVNILQNGSEKNE